LTGRFSAGQCLQQTTAETFADATQSENIPGGLNDQARSRPFGLVRTAAARCACSPSEDGIEPGNDRMVAIVTGIESGPMRSAQITRVNSKGPVLQNPKIIAGCIMGNGTGKHPLLRIDSIFNASHLVGPRKTDALENLGPLKPGPLKTPLSVLIHFLSRNRVTPGAHRGPAGGAPDLARARCPCRS
jgi:hypothetical protein